MAKGKKQDIGDIIRDIMGGLTKQKRPMLPPRKAVGRKIPKPDGEKTAKPPRRLAPLKPRPKFPKRSNDRILKEMPRRAGDKPFDREEAILPRRPKPKNPTAPSRRQMPKRKPKAGPPRRGNY